MKTIKQVADELGVSKDKVKYQVGKLPGNYLVKTGKITHLTDDGILKIREMLLGKEVGNLPGKSGESLPGRKNELHELYRILKIELEAKNEQIASLQTELSAERVHSREQADKLSDLATQLTELTRNNQLLLGAEQSRTNPALITANKNEIQQEKKGILQRLFKRNKK